MNEGRKSWASESFLTRDEYLYLLHTHTVDGTLVSHDADPRTGVYSVTYNLDVAK